MESQKKLLLLDFDGVIHLSVVGKCPPDVIPDPPVPGAFKRLYEYVKCFEVWIFSVRSGYPEGIQAMKDWMSRHDVEYRNSFPDDVEWPIWGIVDEVNFPEITKPPVHLTIDDRAENFDGDWSNPRYDVENIENFRPWNR